MQSSEDPKTQDTSKGLLVQLGLLDIHEEPPGEEPQNGRREGEQTRDNHQPANDRRAAEAAEEHPRDPQPSYQETMDAPHVMISYNWDHQDRALKIRDKLREKGYNIWMDVDKMGVYFFSLLSYFKCHSSMWSTYQVTIGDKIPLKLKNSEYLSTLPWPLAICPNGFILDFVLNCCFRVDYWVFWLQWTR